MIKKILVPVDGSEHANRAVELAANLASQYDATIHLLHVVTLTEIPDGIREYMKLERINESPYIVALQSLGDHVVEAASQKAKEKGAEHVHTTVMEGDPAQSIIDYAKKGGFDMIVIGSRGLGKFQGVMLGSVSTKVCHFADQTCITVK